MLEVEVLGARGVPALPSSREIRRLCRCTAARIGIDAGHVAVAFVDAERIAELNARHRGKGGPTDVLSFPIDGIDPVPGERARARDDLPSPRPTAITHDPGAATTVPRELGDIVICPRHTVDVREAVIHGMLHLLGMDHETDDGEMLALQRELLAATGG